MSLEDFFTEVYNYDYEIPITVKIFTLAIILVIICIIFISSKDSITTVLLKNNYMWVFIVVAINLINMIVVLFYYQYKKDYLKKSGDVGKEGQQGQRGERGKYITCSLCDTDVNLQKSSKYSKVVNLKESVFINENNNKLLKKTNKFYKQYEEFGLLIEDIDVESIFGSSGIKELESTYIKYALKNSKNEDMIKLSQSNNIIEINYILTTLNILIISTVHEYIGLLLANLMELLLSSSLKSITKSLSNNMFEYPGSFYNVGGSKIGFFSLGDTVFNEDSPNRIKAFLANGDIRNPVDFDKMSSFPVNTIGEFNELKTELYTIWRPRAPKGYESIGDIVKIGDSKPENNVIGCLNKNCLDELEIEDCELAFMYYGIEDEYKDILSFNQFNKINTSYDLEEIIKGLVNANNMFSIYSVWRTPLNTFYVNTTNNNVLSNNSVIYNLIEGNPKLLDKYGIVTEKAKKFITSRLKKIKLSKIVRSLILRAYYINFYQKKLKRKKIDLKKIDYYEKLKKQKTDLNYRFKNRYISRKDYNKELSDIYIKINKKPIEELVNTYISKLKNIDKFVANKVDLYDILFTVIPGGYDTLIYVNKSEENSGGIELLSIQAEILKLCKAVIPPIKPVYNIKNECLSFQKIDLKRQRLIKKIKNYLDEVKKMEGIKKDHERYCGDRFEEVENNFKLLESYLLKYLAHIPNGYTKLINLEFDDIPTTRLKIIAEKFKEFSIFLREKCNIGLEDEFIN